MSGSLSGVCVGVLTAGMASADSVTSALTFSSAAFSGGGIQTPGLDPAYFGPSVLVDTRSVGLLEPSTGSIAILAVTFL